jgi:hypothetical protein
VSGLWWLLPGVIPAAVYVAKQREWFLFRINLHHVVDRQRDGDRHNKSIRDQNLSDGEEAIAVTVFYVGPRDVQIVDIGWRFLGDAHWSHFKAGERTLHTFHAERWLIPVRHFDPKYVTSIFLTKEDQTRVVARVNYLTRLWLWNENRKMRRLAQRMRTERNHGTAAN